jgi:hypothetical protein
VRGALEQRAAASYDPAAEPALRRAAAGRALAQGAVPLHRKALSSEGFFTEQIVELPAGARVTGWLRRHVAEQISKGVAVSVACEGLMSWPVARCSPSRNR